MAGGILISIIAHMAMVIVFCWRRKLFPFDGKAARLARPGSNGSLAAREKTRSLCSVQRARRSQAPRSSPRNSGEASDADRLARALQQAKKRQPSSVLAREHPRARRGDAAQKAARGRGPSPSPHPISRRSLNLRTSRPPKHSRMHRSCRLRSTALRLPSVRAPPEQRARGRRVARRRAAQPRSLRPVGSVRELAGQRGVRSGHSVRHQGA